MALNVKQKYPGTQGGAAQLYASDTRLSLRRKEQVFTPFSKSYKENMDISSTRSSSSSNDEEIIVLLNEESRRKRRRYCIFFVFLFLPRSLDATWRISSSSLRMCARQDCFVFERPRVVFYCNFSSSRHVSKSSNLIGRIVFDATLNVGEYRARNSSRCVRALRMTAEHCKKSNFRKVLPTNVKK